MSQSANTTILDFPFSEEGALLLRDNKNGMGQDWPVVYVITGSSEAYVGETSNAYERMKQHLINPERSCFKTHYVFFNDFFNKSAILDIENMLIEHMAADGTFQLQNKNEGQSKYHNYYQRSFYKECFNDLWVKLRKKQLASHSLLQIENSDIFKFSPYKELTDEQYESEKIILNAIADAIANNSKETFIVQGGAGTGKSVLAIALIKYLCDLLEEDVETSVPEVIDDADNLINDLILNNKLRKNGNSLRIGFIVPVLAFKNTVKKVFRNIKSLRNVKVMTPSEVVKEDDFDVLIVDEAHRLKRRAKLTNYGTFDKNSLSLGLNPENCTELDWVEKKAKHMTVLFYDPIQMVKVSDISKETVAGLFKPNLSNVLNITNQLRIKAGKEYIDFWKGFFKNSEGLSAPNLDGYDFRLFSDCQEMIDAVKAKSQEYGGLCGVVAGIAYNWGIKAREKNTEKKNRKPDFEIQGHSYYWNTDRDKAPKENEIGCVYTCQGFDYNLAGVIIGPDVTYNEETHQVEFNIDKFQGDYSKDPNNPQNTINYIINAYLVLLTRGIYGTYLFVHDEKLRKHIQEMFEAIKKSSLNEVLK